MNSIEYWDCSINKVVEIELSTDRSYEWNKINNTYTDTVQLNLETEFGDLFIYSVEYFPTNELNRVIDSVLRLDNTYVADLINPTEDELSYLEILFGELYVDSYKLALETLKRELDYGN